MNQPQEQVERRGALRAPLHPKIKQEESVMSNVDEGFWSLILSSTEEELDIEAEEAHRKLWVEDVFPFLLAESAEQVKRERVEKAKQTIEKLNYSIGYLSYLCKIEPKLIEEVLLLIKSGEKVYRQRNKKKKDGSTRQIMEPIAPLKHVQRKLLRIIGSLHVMPEVSFGGTRGNILEAIEPHLESGSMLRVDIKNAFPSVKREDVWRYFSSWINLHGPQGIEPNHRIFTKATAAILTDLTTYRGYLPQGAPTSSVIFDLLCTHLDQKLQRLAENCGGKYTRYVDNFFFSIPGETFPRSLKQAILKLIENGFPSNRERIRFLINHGVLPKTRRKGPAFGWHKLGVVSIGNRATRMLGLNIINGEIHNTKSFKRSFRKKLHHLNWLLNNKASRDDVGSAWFKLQGLMAFATKETLPPALLEEYNKIRERIQ